MKRLVLTAILAGLAGPALAQDAQQKAMELTVRPSGYEDEERNEALRRQRRLLKLMEEADYSVRSICINCGDEWKHQIYAPFNPLASLRNSSGIPNESSPRSGATDPDGVSQEDSTQLLSEISDSGPSEPLYHGSDKSSD